jgi:hypothetical protein
VASLYYQGSAVDCMLYFSTSKFSIDSRRWVAPPTATSSTNSKWEGVIIIISAQLD